MKLENSILKDIRGSLGLNHDDNSFDPELLLHINTAISKINQNGVGKSITISDEETTWNDLMDSTQVKGNQHFQSVPLFIMLSTKLIFDPPPPSTVQYYSQNANEILWRLKVAYEEPYVKQNISVE